MKTEMSGPVIDMNPILRNAANFGGPISRDIHDRLVAYLLEPTQAGWKGICSLIINPRSMRMGTVWQSVRAIDPTFPNVGPAKGEDWERIPDAITVARAIRQATGQ